MRSTYPNRRARLAVIDAVFEPDRDRGPSARPDPRNRPLRRTDRTPASLRHEAVWRALERDPTPMT